MNWGSIRPGLAELVADLTGIEDDDAIRWRGRASSGGWRRGPRVTMSAKSIVAIGRDELRLSGQADERVMSVCGNRKFTWSLLFESESPDDELVAFEFADRFRAGLKFESSRYALRLLGLSVSSIEPTETLEFNSQGKPFASASIDVIMNAAENLVDESEGAADWIQSASYSSDVLTDQSGTETEQVADTVITED